MKTSSSLRDARLAGHMRTCRGSTCHDWHERPGGPYSWVVHSGQVSVPQSCCDSGDQSSAVVGLQAPLRDRRHAVGPRYPALVGLRGDEPLQCLGRPCALTWSGLAMSFPWVAPVRLASRLESRREPTCTAQSQPFAMRSASDRCSRFRCEVVGGVVQGSPRSKAAAKKAVQQRASGREVARGQDRFPGHVDFGADPGCIVSKAAPASVRTAAS